MNVEIHEPLWADAAPPNLNGNYKPRNLGHKQQKPWSWGFQGFVFWSVFPHYDRPAPQGSSPRSLGHPQAPAAPWLTQGISSLLFTCCSPPVGSQQGQISALITIS